MSTCSTKPLWASTNKNIRCVYLLKVLAVRHGVSRSIVRLETSRESMTKKSKTAPLADLLRRESYDNGSYVRCQWLSISGNSVVVFAEIGFTVRTQSDVSIIVNTRRLDCMNAP